MVDFNRCGGSFLEQDGNFVNYPIKMGEMHREIIENYCQKKGFEPASEQIVLENGIVYVRNTNAGGIFIIYMPSVLTDEQLYQLEVHDKIIDGLEYLAVLKDEKSYYYTSDIWNHFSNEILQSYYGRKKG